MPDPAARWRLELFLERLDMWAAREGVNVDVDLRIVVTAWLQSRMDDPHVGVARAAGFDNLWSGVVPGSGNGQGRVVVCSYWIFEAARVVRCDNFGLLSWPV